jgi:hypothetical protein
VARFTHPKGFAMTQDEIIKMARRAGVRDDENIFEFSQYKYLERFAKLVAKREREACAKVCDVLAYHPEFASDATKLAAMAIRARGQA